MSLRRSNILLITMLSIIILTVINSDSSGLKASTLRTDTSISEAILSSTANSPNIRFIYNGTFTLITEQSQIIIPSLNSTGDPALDPHTELHLDLLSSNDSSSSLLVSILWPTNKIGSTLEQWLYSCDASGSLTLLWSLSDEHPSVESSQVDERTLELSLPDYQHTQSFQLKDDDLKRLLSNSSALYPLAPSDLIQMGPPTSYNINVKGSDYSDKWVVTRMLYLQSPPFTVGNLYTQFRMLDNKVVVEKVFFSSYADPSEPDVFDLSF